jgi:hypothetical protein
LGALGRKIRTALSRPPMACLVCGVDSGPIRNFLFLFIGTLVGATLVLLVWAYLTNRLSGQPDVARLALEAEQREREEPNV